MNSQIKKSYIAPELTTHGNVEEITLQGSLQNADVPNGPNGTANCFAGSTDPSCIS